MNKKQFLILNIVIVLFGNYNCKAYTDCDKDESYTWTEKKTGKKIEKLVKKATTTQGWFCRYYESGTETNGKRILRKVKQKSKKEETNSKIVKRFHPKRTIEFAQRQMIEEFKKIIMDRVGYINYDYECVKKEIAISIIMKMENINDLRAYLNNDFLDEKIEKEIEIYQEQQNAAMYTAMPVVPELPTCDCCGMYVGNTGTAYLLSCHKHEYCSNCYMQQRYPWVCGSCCMEQQTSFCNNCMTGDYCYAGCPKCLDPAEPSAERCY